MTQRLVIALLAIIAFAAGFGVRTWMEKDRALAPPPAIGSEFLQSQSADKKPATKPFDRNQLRAEIEKLRPEIDAYRTRLDAIDADFEKAFQEILSPEQRALYAIKEAAWKKRRADRDARAAASSEPLSDEEIAKLRQRPFETAFWKISFASRLEQCTRDFHLDAAQRTRAKELLAERRAKYLALVDSTPPPTFKLTSIAASVQRLIDPAPASASPTK